MKLKTFEKTNSTVVTEYTVFAPNGTWLESFTVDYLAKKHDNIIKKQEYIKRGADVTHVTVNTVTHNLSVTLISPSWAAALLDHGIDDEEPLLYTAEEIIRYGLYDSAVALMDDDLRETIHRDLAPCTEEEFLSEYLIAHRRKYGAEFHL